MGAVKLAAQAGGGPSGEIVGTEFFNSFYGRVAVNVSATFASSSFEPTVTALPMEDMVNIAMAAYQVQANDNGGAIPTFLEVTASNGLYSQVSDPG